MCLGICRLLRWRLVGSTSSTGELSARRQSLSTWTSTTTMGRAPGCALWSRCALPAIKLFCMTTTATHGSLLILFAGQHMGLLHACSQQCKLCCMTAKRNIVQARGGCVLVSAVGTACGFVPKLLHASDLHVTSQWRSAAMCGVL